LISVEGRRTLEDAAEFIFTRVAHSSCGRLLRERLAKCVRRDCAGSEQDTDSLHMLVEG
jgi:hypothetical protein